MKNPLLKYKIGLGLLVLGVLALVTFVVLQAGGAKQDAQTVQRANDIAINWTIKWQTTTPHPATWPKRGSMMRPLPLAIEKYRDKNTSSA